MNAIRESREQPLGTGGDSKVRDSSDGGDSAVSGPGSVASRWNRLSVLAAVALFCLALTTPWSEVVREGLASVVPMPPGPADGSKSGAPWWRMLGEADQRFVAWQVARNARTLLSRPSELFDAEQCYPAKNVLALSEPMITLGVLGMPFAMVSDDPVWIYNWVLILSMLLAPLAMFFLVKEWTGIPAAGLVAGLLYGFHPDKISDVNHIFIDDTTWTVGALLFAQRYFARGRWRDALLFGVFCALQIGGSFYAFAGSLLVALPVTVWFVLQYGGGKLARPPAFAALGLIAVAAFVVFAPFLEVRSEGVLVERTWRHFAEWKVLLPGGERFPGWIAVGLAGFSLACLRRGTLREKPQLFFAIACALVACTVVSSDGWIEAPPIYLLLERLIPGFDSVRRPNEILVGFHLGFSVLAGLGCGELLRRLPARAAPYLAGVLVLVSFLAMVRPVWLTSAWSGLGSAVVFRALQARPPEKTLAFFDELAERGDRGPIAEAPVHALAVSASRVLVAGYHGRPTSACVNTQPKERKQVRALLSALPESGAIAGLRDLGFATIVVHHPLGGPRAGGPARGLAMRARLPHRPVELLLESPDLTAFRIRRDD